MKKLIFLFAMVFIISMTMAQNASTISQRGNNKEGDVSQIDDKHGATIQVLSGSDPNDVDVMQYGGKGNRVFFLINSVSCDNIVYLDQCGTGNRATGHIGGGCNDVDILQQGDANFVGTSWNSKDGVRITGDNNMVDIDQLTNGNSSINTVTGNGNSISVLQN